MNYFTPETARRLTLVALFDAKPEKRDELKNIFLSLIKETRTEEGSVSYHLYEDRENPNRLIFHETWESTELWEKHMQNPNLRNFLEHAGAYLQSEPVLQRWERSQAPVPVIEKDSLVLFAYNRAKANKEKEWQKILEDLIGPTLAEKGALHYELHISKEDPRDFMFHETWQTVEAWNDHMAAPHLKALLEIIGDYTENGISVIKTKPID